LISIEKIAFSYPKAKKLIFKDFSAEFSPGEAVAVTGKNGCGKTTLVRLLTGIERPSAGRITIDGEDTAGMDLFEIGRLIGCVFQDPARQLFCRTVREEIRFGLENMGLSEDEIESKTAKWAEFFRLDGKLLESFPGTMSGGEKQRVVLAAVLAMGTRYVLLDEPTSSIDMRARRALGELLRDIAAEGRGVIFVSHERSFIESFATRELVLP